AWPYANGSLHAGHIAGCYLPADIFARYHRVKGNQVLMVSGSDMHGTPITIKAEQEGKTPSQVAQFYQQEFLETWRKLGISFDLFTHTETENHARVTQDMFLKLLEKGYIYKDTTSQAYCPKCERFLPDRYVEGTCPYCKNINARGDQCEACGKPLNPQEVVNARCRICGTKPVFRDTEHFFIKLSAFNDRLLDWVKLQTHWRTNVINFTMRYLEDGLKDRAVTRDIEWGVPVPVPGFENKRLYVWFEAVIGYLSASKEWASSKGTPDKWQEFWTGDARAYYFIGKDNIAFHTIFWPAELIGYGGLNLPYDVPANEFLTIDAKKVSTSRNWAVWMPEYLNNFAPDPLRYVLSANMPETSDTDFSWREYVRRNNDELVATYGNLAHRVLTFTYKNFDGKVPAANGTDEAAKQLNTLAETIFKEVDESLAHCNFKQAIKRAMDLAHAANRYLDEQAPWKAFKTDKQAAANSLYTALGVIAALKTMLYPFLPFSSQKLHEYLGFTGNVDASGWKLETPKAGQALQQPLPLFTKLEEEVAETETKKLGH
ncbi:MAG TPA: methionine--tRNA ligase, partial [Dehalococcoidales bacterium]|nr:methionine--tRNA ligase [Dehalococcoidales bacterium]